jgi:hypothetical protein
MKHEELFKHLQEEYDIVLSESELEFIAIIVLKPLLDNHNIDRIKNTVSYAEARRTILTLIDKG